MGVHDIHACTGVSLSFRGRLFGAVVKVVKTGLKETRVTRGGEFRVYRPSIRLL